MNLEYSTKLPVLAAAQCAVRDGDIACNVQRHLCFMEAARSHGVQLLVFPELSLTGYVPPQPSELAQDLDTPLIAPLRNYVREARMTTVIGLPLRSAAHDKPLIAAFVLHADGALSVYTKVHLHSGEELHFAAGNGGDLLKLCDMRLALSVCADFSQPSHAAAAARAGAQVYLSSVLISERGYPADSATLQGYNKTHEMAVLMANHGGPTGGWTSAGSSAFWDRSGQMIASTAGPGNQLMIVSGSHGKWTGFSTAVAISE